MVNLQPLKHNKDHKIPAECIVLFFQQLAILTSTGIMITQALDILASAQMHHTFQRLIQQLKKDTEKGHSLSFAMKKFPSVFDQLTCHFVKIGEQSGTFSMMLQDIYSYHHEVFLFKKQLKEQLYYPIVLSVVAIAISAFMFIIIIPHFSEIFREMQIPLPMLTQWVIHIAELFRHHGTVFLLTLGIASAWVYYEPNIRQLIKMNLAKLPMVNTIILRIQLVYFSRHLATILTAGLPVYDALKLIEKSFFTPQFSMDVRECASKIGNGRKIHQAMQHRTSFSPFIVQMIKIGEEAGNLEATLKNITAIVESDLRHTLSRLRQFVEPLIILILGVLIGVLVIAMYLPIFKLGTAL